MRTHKILGDYRAQAVALCTCGRVADEVSNLVTDLRSIQNADPETELTDRREPVDQMLRPMASLPSCPPAKSVLTGKRVDKLKGNESPQIKCNCSKSIAVCSRASFVVHCTS